MGAPSLTERLEYWARTQPNAVFLTDIETGHSLTYLQTLKAVRGLQQHLGPNARSIALGLPGGMSAAIVWLAALTGGHQLVPCSPEATDSEKARLAETFSPDLAVVEVAELAKGFGEGVARTIIRAELDALVLEWANRGGPVISLEAFGQTDRGTVRLTTSGTTGSPKGVCLRADQFAWTADQIRISHRLTPDDRGLSVLPFFHINAPVVSLCTTMMAGATLIVAPRFSRSRFWSWIKDYQITWASIVPTILAVLLQTERPDWLPGTLRFVRTASAPLPLVQLMAFEKRFGIPVIETYGLSEAAATVAANPVPPSRYKPGSVGRPIGVSLRVCRPSDENPIGRLQDVVTGEEGEICISGPGVIDGYDNGASATSFQDGWFRTGDLGYLDSDGFLFITGRIKDVINRGGEKISPREVEEVMLAHPSVRDAAVIPEPDPIYGQHPVAYVVLDPHQGSDPIAGIREHCAKQLSAYKVPERFEQVAELPRTKTGKIRRHLIGVSPDVRGSRDVRYGVA
jgi:acyl-CoA synthetase (AMP-forming)/AMP-acid ligase II